MWVGDWGGNTANGTELAAGAVKPIGETALEGAESAVNGFREKFDGDVNVPTIDVSSSADGNGGEIIISSGDSYYRILGKIGMPDAEIDACDRAVDLRAQPVLIAGQTFRNPCQ